MTSEELSNQVTSLVESLRTRIVGVGDQEYSEGDTQKIERKNSKQLLTETREELEDAIVYLAFMHSKLHKLETQLRGFYVD
jgi:hypothetical protein